MLIAAYNVFWFIHPEEKANYISWFIINTSYIILPISFYYVGVELKRSEWQYASNIVLSFSISNMIDFLIGQELILYFQEYLFAALSAILITIQYIKNGRNSTGFK